MQSKRNLVKICIQIKHGNYMNARQRLFVAHMTASAERVVELIPLFFKIIGRFFDVTLLEATDRT